MSARGCWIGFGCHRSCTGIGRKGASGQVLFPIAPLLCWRDQWNSHENLWESKECNKNTTIGFILSINYFIAVIYWILLPKVTINNLIARIILLDLKWPAGGEVFWGVRCDSDSEKKNPPAGFAAAGNQWWRFRKKRQKLRFLRKRQWYQSLSAGRGHLTGFFSFIFSPRMAI